MNRAQPPNSDGLADFHYRGPALVEGMANVRRRLTRWARAAGLAAEDVHGLALAAYEAMANVALHAYDGEPGPLDVHASRPADERTVTVTVSDRGHWRPPAANPGPLHGRGLVLIRSLAGTAKVVPGKDGTTVRMDWALPQ